MKHRGPKDDREFIRLAIDIYDNPKVAALDDPAAAWALVVAIVYAGRHKTDGVVPLRTVARMAGVSTQRFRKLVNVSLVHEHGHDCKKCPEIQPGEGYVHDYLEHNRSKAEVEEDRRSRQERGKKGADKRWGTQASPEAPKSDSYSHANSDGYYMAEVERDRDTHLPAYAASNATHANEQPQDGEIPRGPGVTGPRSVDAWRLVDRTTGRDHPAGIRTALAVEVAQLLAQYDEPFVTTCLEHWTTRTGIGPKVLQSIASDLVKEANGANTRSERVRSPVARAGGTGSRRVDVALGFLAPDDPLRAELGLPASPALVAIGGGKTA